MGKGEHEETATNEKVQENTLRLERSRLSLNKIGPLDSMDKPKRKIDRDMDHQQALDRQKSRREREPLLYCKLVTRWPLQSFLITLAGHILMVLISAGLVASGYDLLPVDFENLPLEINNQPWRPRDLAWTYRNSYSGYYDRTPTSGWRVFTYVRANIDLYYESGNVFTKSALQEMESIENSLYSQNTYQSDFCQLSSNGTCEKINSILRYFDGTFSDIDPVFNDPNYDNITGVLYTAFTNVQTKSDFFFFLGKSYQITPNLASSSITRSKIPMGYPLQGIEDRLDYEAKLRPFSVDHMKPLLQDARSNSNNFDFSYRSDMLWLEDVLRQAMKDVMFAAGSICFISIFILIHTKSLWITGFAILSIMTSFVTTNLIYRVVLDFRYIGFFHVLTLFIVLGIGADDIFVFYDVWRNTAYEAYPSLAHRLSDAYRKSVFSMLFTSTTTSVAFFASAISPLLATRSFGVFSGLVIIVNYLSVILYFPTVVIMYHTKFEKFKWPCIVFIKSKLGHFCSKCKKDNSETTEASTHKHESRGSETVTKPTFSQNGDLFRKITPPPLVSKSEKDATNVSIVNNRNSFTTHIKIENSNPYASSNKGQEADYAYMNDVYEPDADENVQQPQVITEATTNVQSTVPKKRKKKSLMVRFFRDKYSRFVTHKIIRWVILAVMLVVLIFFTVQASKLEPDNEGLRVLKDDHVYSVARDHSLHSFVLSNADRTLILYIVWGMHPNDMTNCHFSTPKCKGEQQWDTSFNPNTPEAQTAIQTLCNKMFNWSPAQAAQYRVRQDVTTGENQINCYITNMGEFLADESNITGTDWNLTYNYSKTISFMDARTSDYNSTGFTSNYEDYLQIPMSYWLSNRNSFNLTSDFYMFDTLIGEEEGPYTRTLLSDSTKKYGNKIKYIAIQVNTTLKVQTLGYAEGIPIMNKWEDFVNSEMKQMPNGMKNAFQTTTYIWHWLIVSEMLARNAVYGIIIGVSLALPILIIATRNIITGFLATFSMCCSTVCVIGVIPLGGWKLGVLESLNMCMVVGLTVDYVVHLAEGYTLSLHKDRSARLRDMLDEMAVSVFFGACTTLGASMFMFLAQLSFFQQFGIFMFSTIGFSLFFAMGMFVTLMGLFGPQGDNGNLVVLFSNIRNWCKNRTNNGVPPSESRAQLTSNMPNSASRQSMEMVTSNGRPNSSKP
ncbi:hypothetical protein ACF0H5_003114 [Mactra antiquata]